MVVKCNVQGSVFTWVNQCRKSGLFKIQCFVYLLLKQYSTREPDPALFLDHDTDPYPDPVQICDSRSGYGSNDLK